MKSLGVVVDKALPDSEKIKVLFDKLTKEFEKAEPTKTEVISVIKEYLPNFEHIETGKSLDSKM